MLNINNYFTALFNFKLNVVLPIFKNKLISNDTIRSVTVYDLALIRVYISYTN